MKFKSFSAKTKKKKWQSKEPASNNKKQCLATTYQTGLIYKIYKTSKKLSTKTNKQTNTKSNQ